jgi:actin-related protein 5
MKANTDARKAQKAQRLEEKRLKEEEAQREQEERDKDLTAWSNKMRSQQEVSLSLHNLNLHYASSFLTEYLFS